MVGALHETYYKMIITRAPEDYRNEDEVLYLSGHTNFRMDESFRDILEDMNTNTVLSGL